MSAVERIPELDTFGPDHAWWLGSALVDRCRSEDLPVTISIRLGQQQVFHAALPGTSADNDGWVARKARTVTHFGLSSAAVYERYVKDNPDFLGTFALSPADYAPYPGAVPITVRGTLVGTLAISGLTGDQDHDLAIDALRDEAAYQGDTSRSRPHRTKQTPSSPDLSQTYRHLQPNQRSQVWIGGPDLDQPQLLFETDDLLIEAPNWSLDGTTLYVNGHGHLWAVDLADDNPSLRRIELDNLVVINNDHVLSRDGRHIYLSAMDGHIYRAPLAGGTIDRVTVDDGVWHFLHGVSPDDTRLAYVRLTDFADPGQLAVMTPHGSSTIIEVGAGHIDGPEWSPDGTWIYLNTEAFTTTRGHAQIARLPDGGGTAEHLVRSDTVDWFPHLSPDSRYATYISFPAGTLGHPPNLPVTVHLVATDNWQQPIQTYPLLGGQGTLNVNSWSPDSTRFAYIAYPTGPDPQTDTSQD